MNREQVIQTLTVLKAAFPHSYKNMTRADGEAMIALWERQFAEEDPIAVSAAVEALIATRTAGYSPTVGEIKDQIHRLRTADGLNEAQAWALVEKACRRGLYNSREEFEKLPPDVQAAVGGPEQLKAWASMDAETVNSVVASNFQKTFRTVRQREKERIMMPPEVKAFLAGVADRMKITDGNPKQAALEARQKPTLLPSDLKPLLESERTLQEASRRETSKPEKEYKPPAEDEWLAKREAALSLLNEK